MASKWADLASMGRRSGIDPSAPKSKQFVARRKAMRAAINRWSS